MPEDEKRAKPARRRNFVARTKRLVATFRKLGLMPEDTLFNRRAAAYARGASEIASTAASRARHKERSE